MSNQTVNYIFNITGNANDVINNINQNTGVLNRTLSQTLNVFDSWKGSFVAFQSVGTVFQNIQSVIGGITQAGSNAELQLMNMKTLFGGNAEAAQDMYDRISKYGKETPYDKAGLIEAQKTMMSFGIEGEKVVRLRDTERKEDARYYVTGVEIEFGQNGAKRKVKLGRKLTY